MKATEAKLLDFLKKSPQFVIPIYQRTYSWTERECIQLWDDIIRAGSSNSVLAHFVGSIVYIEKGLYQVSSQSPLLVIDGQQRLTTITLLLTALAKHLDSLEESQREPVDGFSPRKIRNYYLLNPEEDGEKQFKLILSQTDKITLTSLVANSVPPKELSIRVSQNYAMFEKLVQDNSKNLTTLCKGIAKLIVVDIALSRDQDNPQLIFESMNSTGRELSQADLIRNYILMGLEPKLQTQLYENYWHPMEVDFGQEAYVLHFDGFMRHYLTMKTGEIPNQNEVYDAFKAFSRTGHFSETGISSLVKDIRDFSTYFCAMALGRETDDSLKQAFHDLRELKVDVAYPLLLEMYHDYKSGILLKSDFISLIRFIEGYVFRRAVCKIPTNSMNKTFANFTKNIEKERYLESAKAHFLLLPSYRRYPNDDEFKRDIQTRDLYNFRSRSYWLRRIENHDRKERVSVDEYTIEHILPQNESLSKSWKDSLGENWESVQQTWLHTLGNLTLTGYNSEYSDRPFKEKRDMKGGFKESPLKVNAGLASVENWNANSIQERAKSLATTALKVWVSPTLSGETLQKYKVKPEGKSTYTIADHTHLSTGPVLDLFNAFRSEVQRLDQCVTEEFLKLYVAYKAETNFVDVIPLSKRLRLTLNIPFSELIDPKNIARDITGLGRWGNGDVEVNLQDLSELPYVIGLVRQALDRQLEDGT